MAFLAAVLELKWFALKAFADVTVRPHPRQCCNISPRRSLLNFSRAGFDGHALTFLLGPPVASLVRCELIRTRSLRRDALVRKPFSDGQQSANLFFKSSFLWSEFGCAQTQSTLGLRGQRSTVCAKGFRIETGRGCRAQEAHEINHSQHSLGKLYRPSLFGEPLAAAGGAEFGAVPSANTVSWPPRDV